jgi:two-component system cell cycle response regulator
VTSPGHSSRQERLDAMRAGAWDFLGSALDSEELPLRLDAYVRAKFDADRLRDDSLMDQNTGLYNVQGLARRSRELGSLAFRHHEPFACVVLSPVVVGPPGDAAADSAFLASVERLGKAIRERGRVSDATGRLGPHEFAIIAHGTDEAGALRMAERLTEELRAASPNGRGPVKVAGGYDVVPDYHESPIDPSEMLARATKAMRLSRSDTGGKWIRQFEPNGVH